MVKVLLETKFRSKVVKRARELGWRVHYSYDTQQSSTRKNKPGFPDLVLVQEGRLLFRELKTDDKNSQLRPEQVDWLKDLELAGADAGVWRPADWDRIERELNTGEVNDNARCGEIGEDLA